MGQLPDFMKLLFVSILVVLFRRQLLNLSTE